MLIGNGDATFQRAVTYPLVGAYGRGIALADLNADTRPDAIVSVGFHSNGITGALGILLGNGDGTFQPGLVYESGGSQAMGSADSGDMNGDGWPDIVSPQYHLNQWWPTRKRRPGCAAERHFVLGTCGRDHLGNAFLLWPPNGGMIPVQVSGIITSAGAECPVAAVFSVTDEYGIVQPAGPINVSPLGAYSFHRATRGVAPWRRQ